MFEDKLKAIIRSLIFEKDELDIGLTYDSAISSSSDKRFWLIGSLLGFDVYDIKSDLSWGIKDDNAGSLFVEGEYFIRDVEWDLENRICSFTGRYCLDFNEESKKKYIIKFPKPEECGETDKNGLIGW